MPVRWPTPHRPAPQQTLRFRAPGNRKAEPMTDPLESPANRAYLQTAYLVELLLSDKRDDVKDVIGAMQGEEIMPLLGAALIFGAEAMRDHFGTEGAVEQIAELRRKVNAGGGFDG